MGTPPKNNSPWCEDAIRRLGELWKTNTAKDIAYILNREFDRGFSRNGVIGKSQRLGLSYKSGLRKERAKAAKFMVRPNVRHQSSVALRAVEKRRREQPAVSVPSLPTVTSDPYEQRERRRLAFEQMSESKGCKFPVGDLRAPDFHFCCAPRSAESYCDHHQAITHQVGTAIAGRRSVSYPTSLHMAAE